RQELAVERRRVIVVDCASVVGAQMALVAVVRVVVDRDAAAARYRLSEPLCDRGLARAGTSGDPDDIGASHRRILPPSLSGRQPARRRTAKRARLYAPRTLCARCLRATQGAGAATG